MGAARVIPIGDGLDRVIGQIIPPRQGVLRHRRGAGLRWLGLPREAGWAACPSPAAGAGHPSQIAYGKILSRFKRLSRTAGARRSDGTELVLRPHDCRRVFASAHLNNATPIFRRMLSSHEAALERARVAREPAGQLAARELEVQRISSALRRAGDLDDDVAAAIETA